MAKTKEEMNELVEEVKALQNKLSELSEEELDEVSGGVDINALRRVAPIMGVFLRMQSPVVSQSQPGEELKRMGGNDPLIVVDGLPEREQ